MKKFILGIFFTSAASLAAQSAPVEEGHSIIVSETTVLGMHLLGTSGDMEVMPVLTYGGYGFAYDATSDLLFGMKALPFAGLRLVSVNPRTGQQTVIGSGTAIADGGPMASHPVSGELYYLNSWNDHLYTIDRQTGIPTIIGWGVPPRGNPLGLAFHPQSHELYTVLPGGSNWGLYTIDIGTGLGTFVTYISSEIWGLAFDDQGTLFGLRLDYAHVGPQQLVTIDLVSGVTTAICDYPPQPYSWLAGLTFVPPLSSPSLSVSPAAPIGGQSVTVSLSHAKAEADTWLTWSLAGPGAFSVPQLGITLGLAPPIRHGNSQLSRLDGRIAFSGMVPPLVGIQVWMQAAQAGVISEVQTFTIQ